jgi:hypothetical protein
MKKITLGIAIMTAVFASSPSNGAEGPRGVAAVDVILKENPSKRAMTDTRGIFAFDGLPAGSYSLIFKAKKAKGAQEQATNKVTVATSYSIRIDGGRRVVKSGLTSDNLIGGFELRVDGAGSKIRGQVTADALKNMVWIPREPGSNIPGRWVEANSSDAKRAFKSQAIGMSGEGLQRWRDNNADEHQEGFRNLNPTGGR